MIDFSCSTIRRLTLLCLHPSSTVLRELINDPLRMNLKSSGEFFTGILKDHDLIPTDSLLNHTHKIKLVEWL